MPVFVYFNDDYPDNGGIGFEKFDSRADAARFIEGRMKHSDAPNLTDYTVVEGTVLDVKAVKFATRIEVSR